MSGLRARWRVGAVVPTVSLVGAAIAAVIAGGAPSRAVSLRAGGHPPPAVVRVPEHRASSVAPTASLAQGDEVVAGTAVTAAPALDAGVGSAAPSSAPTSDTQGPVGHLPEAQADHSSVAAAAPSPTPAAGPTSQPAPVAAGAPPGLGARLLPGPPSASSIPIGPAPSRPPPSSGPARYPSGSAGYDISWPQCGQAYPPRPYEVAIVGVNDGQAFSANPCLASEASWAGSAANLYININSPTSADSTDESGPAGSCVPGDNACLAYNYGYNAAGSSIAVAADQGVAAPTWWLDVETAGRCSRQFPTKGTGYWSCDTSLNATTIQGAIDGLRHAGLVAGDYSTSDQWGAITGGFVPSGGRVPNWIAGADPATTSSWCSGAHDFGGGPPWLLQLAIPAPYDQDRAC